MAYEYDVFLSYTTASSNGAWVKEHFQRLFTEQLENAMPRNPSIFVFEDQETATAWPDMLARALRRSKVLLSVLSPPYFRSPWCVAEWSSMIARERMLSLGTEVSPRLLIHPIVYADGKHFPAEAHRNYSRDFSKWNYPYSSFKESRAYLDFFDAVEVLAQEIAARLDEVPPWQPDFPIVRPEPQVAIPSQLERLS